jgi:hypothetical protein
MDQITNLLKMNSSRLFKSLFKPTFVPPTGTNLQKIKKDIELNRISPIAPTYW